MNTKNYSNAVQEREVRGMDERMNNKFILTLQLISGLKAYEWRRIKEIVDRQYEEKASKLTLDDLSGESIKKWFELEFTQ